MARSTSRSATEGSSPWSISSNRAGRLIGPGDDGERHFALWQLLQVVPSDAHLLFRFFGIKLADVAIQLFDERFQLRIAAASARCPIPSESLAKLMSIGHANKHHRFLREQLHRRWPLGPHGTASGKDHDGKRQTS